MKQSRTLEAKVARYEKMCSQWDDLYTLCEMALEDNDDSMLPELTEGYAQLEQEMENARLETLLSGEYDNNNAIISFQAGAGGTEAQDWASEKGEYFFYLLSGSSDYLSLKSGNLEVN